MSHSISDGTLRSFLTVKQFANKYPAFHESSLRWLLFNQDRNGFSAAFVKLGRRVLIDEQKFFQVVDGENQDS